MSTDQILFGAGLILVLAVGSQVLESRLPRAGWHDRACFGAVGGVGGFVVVGALGQAVPEDFEPPVAQASQGGVVSLAGGDLGFVELAGPGGAVQAAERPLLDGLAEVPVVGRALGDVNSLRPDRRVTGPRPA